MEGNGLMRRPSSSCGGWSGWGLQLYIVRRVVGGVTVVQCAASRAGFIAFGAGRLGTRWTMGLYSVLRDNSHRAHRTLLE